MKPAKEMLENFKRNKTCNSVQKSDFLWFTVFTLKQRAKSGKSFKFSFRKTENFNVELGQSYLFLEGYRKLREENTAEALWQKPGDKQPFVSHKCTLKWNNTIFGRGKN